MERTCASLDEYGPDRSRAEIRELGQAIATGGLEPGTWVLCEARQTSQDRGQELWLGRTVGRADWGGACVREAPVPADGSEGEWHLRSPPPLCCLLSGGGVSGLGTAEITGRSAPFPLSSL